MASNAPVAVARPVYLNGVLLGWCYNPVALAQKLQTGILEGPLEHLVAEITGDHVVYLNSTKSKRNKHKRSRASRKVNVRGRAQRDTGRPVARRKTSKASFGEHFIAEPSSSSMLSGGEAPHSVTAPESGLSSDLQQPVTSSQKNPSKRDVQLGPSSSSALPASVDFKSMYINMAKQAEPTAKLDAKGNKSIRYSFHPGKEKPFWCELCGYRCNAMGRLKRHMMTHTGERPFACPHCSYRASRKSHLTNHLVTHTGVKPFRCTICDYRCARKSHLNRHVEALHIEIFEDAIKMSDKLKQEKPTKESPKSKI